MPTATYRPSGNESSDDEEEEEEEGEESDEEDEDEERDGEARVRVDGPRITGAVSGAAALRRQAEADLFARRYAHRVLVIQMLGQPLVPLPECATLAKGGG